MAVEKHHRFKRLAALELPKNNLERRPQGCRRHGIEALAHTRVTRRVGNAIDGFQIAFKALLDLQLPNDSMVFVPLSQNPSEAELLKLDAINAKITSLGGDPMTAIVETDKADGTPESSDQFSMN